MPLLFSSTVDEEDEYECVSVLNSHTQDVKHRQTDPRLSRGISASEDTEEKSGFTEIAVCGKSQQDRERVPPRPLWGAA